MLIIPLHRKPTAANWPWVTTLFVLINVFVYFALQSKDNKAEARAQIYYFEQKLDEIEFPLYLAYHERGHSQDTGYDFDTLQNVLRGPAYRDLLFTAVNLDHGFQRALADGGALAEQRQARDPEGRWAHTRATVDTLLGYGTTWNYALRYDRIEFRRLFGSMFLHGSFGHLFGNMIFLALLGLLVEGALGSALYAMLYVLAGLGSALFSVYWRYGESGFGVGASGAIAGLMGAYCVLWGMRKVRFFYWFFVVFNYVRAPALVLLPLWLGWEVWQLLTNTGSNVSFDAHAGGIVSGALLAVLIRFCRLQRTAFMEDDSLPSQDRRGEAQEALRNELGRMDWFAARRS
jgi:membrane associated rhomboid family serine protease